jgi:hypothetical protein
MKPRLISFVKEPRIDIAADLRADILKRDWSIVHVTGDKRPPLFMLDRPKRTWRG